eukprot:GHVS01005750.1.p2 GENE.GHVS01005750.1~~GHVS01005750.1.p2  ORF type:complete len:166 (+),score=37.51 GHVS01005750.1:102-599(+)
MMSVPPYSVFLLIFILGHWALYCPPHPSVASAGSPARELAVLPVVKKVLTLAVFKLDNIEERKQGKQGNDPSSAYYHSSQKKAPGIGGNVAKQGAKGRHEKTGRGGGRRRGEERLDELMKTTIELKKQVEKQRIENEKLVENMRNAYQGEKTHRPSLKNKKGTFY